MGLQWEFSSRSTEVVFMDLNIKLNNGRIHTSLYAKPMALHLYIPPSSCHAPGIATGLIYGHFNRVYQLCSHQRDIDNEIHLFFNRLLDRGYSLTQLVPLFLTAEEKAKKQVTARQLQQQNPHPPSPQGNQDVFFHLRYHSANPPSKQIQHMWQSLVMTPKNNKTLNQLHNRDGYPISIRKLTVAYSRAPNLGNILSCRKLRVKIGDYTDLPPTLQNI